MFPDNRFTQRRQILPVGTDLINRPKQKEKGGVFAAKFRGGNVQETAASAAGPYIARRNDTSVRSGRDA
jgi:hypothetical protein